MLAIFTTDETLLINEKEKDVSFILNDKDTDAIKANNLDFTLKCATIGTSSLTICQMIDILHSYLTEEERIKNANAEFDVTRQKELEKRGIL